MLEVRNLQKRYGDVVAVDGVSLSAGVGQTVGLLGPNGAGKTTTVSIIAGLIRPEAGQVLIEGRSLAGDTDPIKRRIGLVPQDLALYDELSARDNLSFFGSLYGLDRTTLKRAIAEALELVGLTDRAKDKVGTFSGGVLGFVGICVAFSLMTGAVGLLIAALGKTPEAARGLAIFVTLILVMLGGAWVPTFVFPQWLQKLTIVIPTRWAVDGLDAMTWRGLGLSSAIGPIAVLLLFSLISHCFFGLGVAEAITVTPIIKSLLYEVSPTEFPTFSLGGAAPDPRGLHDAFV
jgi:ABC-type Na+ transport system ATPase subunit NatA